MHCMFNSHSFFPFNVYLQAEFDAEQEYMKTLSYLTADKQKEYRDKQSVSFMYQKPVSRALVS